MVDIVHANGPGLVLRLSASEASNNSSLVDTAFHNGKCSGIYLGHERMHLADLKSYLEADERMCELYANPDEWALTAILNVAASGKFSSDRTIADYEAQIWEAKPCPVA
jgi:glucan phosphorylase